MIVVALVEIFGDAGNTIKLDRAKEGSSIGAALIAMLAA